MKALLVLFFLFLYLKPNAQFIEKIYLKDSTTTYTGWVVEQVPQEYLKLLRQKEQDTIVIATDQIWKIVRVLDRKVGNPFSLQPQTGLTQAVYLEVSGSGLLYSLNYDRRLKKNKRNGWGIRAGLGFIGAAITEAPVGKIGRVTLMTIPLQINYLLGTKRSALELGAGFTPLFAFGVLDTATNYYFENFRKRASEFYVAPTAHIGYRYTALKKGFMFRISLNPSVVFNELIVGVGLSAGYHFTTKKKKNAGPQLTTR